MSAPLLLPRHGIKLCVDQAAAPEVLAKFGEHFRAAWKRIPLKARRDVLRVWRLFGRAKVAKLLNREYRDVVVAADLAGDVYGLCDSGRCYYDARKLATLDDSSVEWVAAHELCHTAILATTEWELFSSSRLPGYSTGGSDYTHDAEEQHVRQQLHAWGFGLPPCWPVLHASTTVGRPKRRRAVLA